MAKSFKASTTISTDQKNSRIVTAIFDNRADPNLIQEHVMLTTWLKKMQKIPANTRAAINTTVLVEGVASLQVQIGGHFLNAAFVVATELNTNMILKISLIERENKVIETDTRKIIPKHG